jgi:hypothetical protein
MKNSRCPAASFLKVQTYSKPLSLLADLNKINLNK